MKSMNIKPKNKRWKKVLLISVLVLVFLVFYLIMNKEISPQGLIYGNGHIEGTEVKISAEISGKIVKSNLVEGQKINAGDTLVLIDDKDIKIRVAKAKEQKISVEQEIQKLKNELKVWEHHLKTANRSLKDYQSLWKTRNTTLDRLEKAEDTVAEANGKVGSLNAQIIQMNAQVKVADHSIALIQSELEKTNVLSPISGSVLAKAVEEGEYVNSGNLVAVILNLSSLELKVFVPEPDVGKIKLGSPARIKVNAFPKKYFKAKVIRVDQKAQFTPREVHMPDERVRMVFGVILAIENPQEYLKPGMLADAWILWDSSSSWPEQLKVPK